MIEKTVRERIRLKIGGLLNVILLSNPTGLGVVGEIEKFRPGAQFTRVKYPRYIAFGLGGKPGKEVGGQFPDMVGIQRIRITRDMVGQEVGVFIGIECKRPGAYPSPGQIERIALINALGGRAGVAHSVEEAEAILNK